jgi:hypothetical protein
MVHHGKKKRHLVCLATPTVFLFIQCGVCGTGSVEFGPKLSEDKKLELWTKLEANFPPSSLNQKSMT